MQSWMNELAAALGEEPLSHQETASLLGVARDVAHRVERKVTPAATFVIGCAVGRRLADGSGRAETLAEALERVRGILPPPSEE
jgi:hypothetical protein